MVVNIHNVQFYVDGIRPHGSQQDYDQKHCDGQNLQPAILINKAAIIRKALPIQGIFYYRFSILRYYAYV